MVCSQERCRNCGELGHTASGCSKPKCCNACGALDHLFRNCPQRKQTYSDATRGRGRSEVDDLISPREEVLEDTGQSFSIPGSQEGKEGDGVADRGSRAQ